MANALKQNIMPPKERAELLANKHGKIEALKAVDVMIHYNMGINHDDFVIYWGEVREILNSL